MTIVGARLRFPTREDYIRQLVEHGLIVDAAGFVDNDHLTEAVYLDWLRRRQVGCVFAQLLARPANRTRVRTVVVRGASGTGNPSELAIQIDRLVGESVNNASDEALSVLMPQILDAGKLAHLVWELCNRPRWDIEIEHPWRGTLVLIGLRVEIASGIVAETLGMGPFSIFPTTRQCPITTLEIRTKTIRKKRSQVSETRLAAHLADIDVDDILTSVQFQAKSKIYTPLLKKRILGDVEDMRAKAKITYSIPAAIWESLKMRDA